MRKKEELDYFEVALVVVLLVIVGLLTLYGVIPNIGKVDDTPDLISDIYEEE